MAKAKSRTLFKNIKEILTLSGVSNKDGRQVTDADLSRIANAAMVVEDGKIRWVGAQKDLPKELKAAKKNVDFKGKSILPGFVECHTHTVFAGSRSDEFELRNTGVSYQEIAARGGGIISTMTATRKTPLKVLEQLTQKRVNRFIEQGVTTLEIKTGYALDFDHEIKCLQLMRGLGPIRIVPTYLGAHSIPPEFKSAQDYLNFLLQKLLPAIRQKKLSKRVDIFVEKGFFEKDQSRAYLKEAKALGFEIAIHADQLSLSGGADLAVELGALSGDHLIQIKDSEIAKLAKSKTTCVLLPTADLYLDCPFPPARKLIDAGARVALATDFNPGSAPSQELSLVGLLARLKMKMSLPEVIAAYTFNAASALGLGEQIGSLEAGKYADFISIDGDWRELFYSAGAPVVDSVYLSGKQIYSQPN